VVVNIGGVPVCLRTRDPTDARTLAERYAACLEPSAPPGAFELEIHLAPSAQPAGPDLPRPKRGGSSRRILRPAASARRGGPK